MKNDLRQLSSTDYQVVIDETVSYLSDFDVVKSIYQIGGVSAPGISDLDLVIVLDNESKNFTQIWHDYMKNQSEKSKYIFTHHPFLVNESIFSNGDFLTIFPIFNLVNLYGVDYDINIGYDRDDFICNYLDSNLPFWNSEFDSNNIDSMRQNLLRLHSFIYPLRMIENVTGYNSEDTKNFIFDIKALRENAFVLGDSAIFFKIDELIGKAKELSLEINEKMAFYISEQLGGLELAYKIDVQDSRYIVSNYQENSLDSSLLINAFIYKTIEKSPVERYIDKIVKLDCYDDTLYVLRKNSFFNKIRKKYVDKSNVYGNYLPWLIENQIGWGALSTPLFGSFLSYFCTAPEHYENKIKHIIKMRMSKARFFYLNRY